jgi:hypothetical protein
MARRFSAFLEILCCLATGRTVSKIRSARVSMFRRMVSSSPSLCGRRCRGHNCLTAKWSSLSGEDVLFRTGATIIAVLRINAGGVRLPTIEFGDSERLKVGDGVIAIGNPFGLGQTVTSGIVSAVARTSFGVGDFRFFIQTDAAINPGNSGGALIRMDGKLVGINTAIYSTSGGLQGLGFAIPSSMVRVIVESALSLTLADLGAA